MAHVERNRKPEFSWNTEEEEIEGLEKVVILV